MVRYIPESMHKIWEWLTFADYEAAKERGALDVVARYTRGNVLTQNASLLDESSLRDLAAAGDKAAKILREKVLAS